MRTSSRPASRKRSANQSARADSPKGGAGILAISICHCISCGSCMRSQLKADRTSGDAARRITSCCTAGAIAGKSAREEAGLMGSIATVYNAEKGERNWRGRGRSLGLVRFALLRFRQPSAAQLFGRDVRHVGLEIENGRAVEHIDSANMEIGAFTAEQAHDGEADWVGAPGRARGEHAVGCVIARRRADQFESLRAIELPE